MKESKSKKTLNSKKKAHLTAIVDSLFIFLLIVGLAIILSNGKGGQNANNEQAKLSFLESQKYITTTQMKLLFKQAQKDQVPIDFIKKLNHKKVVSDKTGYEYKVKLIHLNGDLPSIKFKKILKQGKPVLNRDWAKIHK